MASRALVDVSAYRDYRSFLADHYARRSAHKGGCSYAEFARRLGLRSPHYLKLVMDGARNRKPDSRCASGRPAASLAGLSTTFARW
ncbi:MAG: hypothetical protein OEZ06_23260 [Myxococcales bacterium]|nr:hypothetical protein [Myxococcales bacterium]